MQRDWLIDEIVSMDLIDVLKREDNWQKFPPLDEEEIEKLRSFFESKGISVESAFDSRGITQIKKRLEKRGLIHALIKEEEIVRNGKSIDVNRILLFSPSLEAISIFEELYGKNRMKPLFAINKQAEEPFHLYIAEDFYIRVEYYKNKCKPYFLNKKNVEQSVKFQDFLEHLFNTDLNEMGGKTNTKIGAIKEVVKPILYLRIKKNFAFSHVILSKENTADEERTIQTLTFIGCGDEYNDASNKLKQRLIKKEQNIYKIETKDIYVKFGENNVSFSFVLPSKNTKKQLKTMSLMLGLICEIVPKM